MIFCLHHHHHHSLVKNTFLLYVKNDTKLPSLRYLKRMMERTNRTNNGIANVGWMKPATHYFRSFDGVVVVVQLMPLFPSSKCSFTHTFILSSNPYTLTSQLTSIHHLINYPPNHTEQHLTSFVWFDLIFIYVAIVICHSIDGHSYNICKRQTWVHPPTGSGSACSTPAGGCNLDRPRMSGRRSPRHVRRPICHRRPSGSGVVSWSQHHHHPSQTSWLDNRTDMSNNKTKLHWYYCRCCCFCCRFPTPPMIIVVPAAESRPMDRTTFVSFASFCLLLLLVVMGQ